MTKATKVRNGPTNGSGLLKELLSYRLHRVASAMSRGAELQYRRQFGTSLAEWRAVALLGERPTSLNELARAADLDKSQMSRVVRGLIDRGLVVRVSETGRGKTVELDLTKRGRGLCARMLEAAIARNLSYLGALEPGEAEALQSALVKIEALARMLHKAELRGSPQSVALDVPRKAPRSRSSPRQKAISAMQA